MERLAAMAQPIVQRDDQVRGVSHKGWRWRMAANVRNVSLILAALALAGLTATAGLTGKWVLTAIVIGFLFGFAMQRASFCGSSILSLFVLERAESAAARGASPAVTRS